MDSLTSQPPLSQEGLRQWVSPCVLGASFWPPLTE